MASADRSSKQSSIDTAPRNSSSASPGAPDPCAFDHLLRSQEVRLTYGLPLCSSWLACADWAVHLTNAPARRAELSAKANEQWKRFFSASTAVARRWHHSPQGGAAKDYEILGDASGTYVFEH